MSTNHKNILLAIYDLKGKHNTLHRPLSSLWDYDTEAVLSGFVRMCHILALLHVLSNCLWYLKRIWRYAVSEKRRS